MKTVGICLALLAAAGTGLLAPYVLDELGVRSSKPFPAQAAAPGSSGTVVARGRIEPLGGVIVVGGLPDNLSTVAVVGKLLVEQGSKVVQGQVLAVLSGYDLSAADLEVSRANLRIARLQRAQLQAGTGKASEIAAQANVVASRQAQLLRTEKDYERAKVLVQRSAASVQALDTDKAALDQITQDVAQAQNMLKSLFEVRPVDDALATGQVALAEANVARATAALQRLEIRAGTPGTVLSIATHGGEMLSGDGILRLGDLDHLIVVAEVDETEIGKVALGEAASIAGPLLPQPIAATVSRIAKEVHRESRPSSDILLGRDARIVEVDLTPRQPLPEVIGAEVTVRLTGSAGAR